MLRQKKKTTFQDGTQNEGVLTMPQLVRMNFVHLAMTLATAIAKFSHRIAPNV